MLQFITSILTILMSGLVAATATFIMNSSKEYNNLLRQKGEELVKDILELKKILYNMTYITDKIAYTVQDNIHIVFNKDGTYKPGKTKNDMENIIASARHSASNGSDEEILKTMDIFARIQLVSRLYFPELKDRLDSFVREDLEKVSINRNKDFIFSKTGKFSDLQRDISEFKKLREENSTMIVDMSEEIIDLAVERVSSYTRREASIARSLMNRIDNFRGVIVKIFKK